MSTKWDWICNSAIIFVYFLTKSNSFVFFLQIVILGQRDNESTVVAVDDVAIEDGVCAPYGSCTFERDFCTWRNLPRPYSSGLQWVRNSGSTINSYTGPSVDVTTNSSEGKLFWYGNPWNNFINWRFLFLHPTQQLLWPN